jgi:iron complex transport system substrate-binding protein
VYQLDVAMLDEVKPDLILTQDLCDVCAVSYQRVNDAVRMIDLDTTVVSMEARTIGGILDTVDAVAALTDTAGRAAEIRADAEGRLAALPGAVSGAPTVLFVEWLDPLMPGGHWVPEQITYAGGRSLLLGPGAHSTPHRWSVVADLAPDVVVFGPCGFTPERTVDELTVATGQPGWADLPAVRNGQVWVVDGPAYFNRPGPRVVDGAEILAAILAGRPDPRARHVPN